MGFTAAAVNGVLHHYSRRLVAFEHTPVRRSDKAEENILIWVGGLGDGFLTTPYPTTLAQSLPSGWTLAQPLLSSSYSGFGTASLESDAQELGECVSYFSKTKSGKIVLMGLSTGCQDVIQYLHTASKPVIHGAIIQSSASDREALSIILGPEAVKKAIDIAEAMVARGELEDLLPSWIGNAMFGAPITARRFMSFASPNHDGDDDMFSSDLSDERLKKIFGTLPASTALCILYSGSDQYVPASVDKHALLKRWVTAVKEEQENF